MYVRVSVVADRILSEKSSSDPEEDMNESRRKQIGQIADSVRSALRLSKFPISREDLEEAIKRLGGRIIEATPSVPYEASIRKAMNSFEISLDRNKPPKRQLFSLAHELGHLFVHMGFGNSKRWSNTPDYVESYARSGYDQEEFVANEFAAALLMPESEITKVVKAGHTIREVADHFGVSQEAALIRGRWLGLYPWA
jgi:Zn-dependent peptidase ImmA (M78 family)